MDHHPATCDAHAPAEGVHEIAHAPAVVVHDAAQARLALALAGAGGVRLLSAPAAAGALGAAGFLAMIAAARHDLGAAAPPHAALLDCGAAPGHALAALRTGLRDLVLDPACPGYAAVRGAATEVGARLLAARPPALDLGGLDLRGAGGKARLQAWLAGAPTMDGG